jgi:hypothetical protein
MESARMRRGVFIELFRRAVSLVLFIAALVALAGSGNVTIAAGATAAAVMCYFMLPRPVPPEAALYQRRFPSVWLPDILGFGLAAFFLGMPIIAAQRGGWETFPWALGVLCWAPGLAALVFLWVAVKSQCYWVRVLPGAVEVATVLGLRCCAFENLTGVQPVQRTLPRWLNPGLILLGRARETGSAFLTGVRPFNYLEIGCLDGGFILLPIDAFPGESLFSALTRAGVPQRSGALAA